MFVSFNQIIKNKAKYMITADLAKLLLKLFYFFSLMYIRMSKKIKKSEFYENIKHFRQMMLM